MINVLNPFDRFKKRKKNIRSFNQEEINILKFSDNIDSAAEDFNQLFNKLLKLVKFSQNKLNNKLDGINKNESNILKKFLNYMKTIAIKYEKNEEQNDLFNDICYFINTVYGDPYIHKTHNAIPKTSLKGYNENTFGKQLMNNIYPGNWNYEKRGDGGSCGYWSLLFYNFFNNLKEAGLDIDVSFYRFNKFEGEIAGCPFMRHSGVIVTYKGKDYLVEYDGINLNHGGKVIQSIDEVKKEIKSDSKKFKNVNDDSEFFENYKTGKRKNNEYVSFFTNPNELIEHINKYPELYRIAFYKDSEGNEKPNKYTFTFFEFGIEIGINGKYITYYLRDNKNFKGNFLENFIDKIHIANEGTHIFYLDNEGKKEIKNQILLLKNKINEGKLKNYFSSGTKFNSDIIEFKGSKKIMIS